MSARETLEKHISELETLVSMIRFDLINLKSGNKHASVDARKRLSVVSKLAQSLRGDCLSVAKSEEQAQSLVTSARPAAVESDNITHLVETSLLEITEPPAVVVEVLEPEEKSILHTIAIDNLKREVEQSKSPLTSKNPRSRKPKLSRKKAAK